MGDVAGRFLFRVVLAEPSTLIDCVLKTRFGTDVYIEVRRGLYAMGYRLTASSKISGSFTHPVWVKR